jgi:Amidase
MQHWLSMELDAMISPAGVLPAIPHKYSGELYFLNSHFMLYNILDYPSGVVPVKMVQHDDLKDVHFNEPGGNSLERPQDRIDEFMHLALQGTDGLPVGV